MITAETIIQAHERIKPYLYRTPVLTSEAINDLTSAQIFFKAENLQHVGAFKARGAMNAALSLSSAELSKGIATHSSGNHAQAIARAASILKTKAFIVMPSTSPEIKKKGVREYGGEIFECKPTLESRVETLNGVIARTGATEIHPFNNYEVMAGQATAAKELFEDINDLDIILAPVGGGGLLSGTALSTKYFSPKTIVIAGEPQGADDAFRSLKSGKIEQSQANTIADGLLTSVGEKPFPVIKELVSEVITVSDQEIKDAMQLLWEKLRTIVEPSGAVPMAAVLKSAKKFEGKKLGIILSGGNVDFGNVLKLFNQ